MSLSGEPKFFNTGWISFLAGMLMGVGFALFIPMPSLRGPYVIPFLVGFAIAGSAYLLAVLRLERDRLPIWGIWGFAILFRLILLFTAPTLSDDVYRYVWDGHLMNQGVNPYTLPVSSSQLDPYDIPARELVNHDWMASPYLPVAQFLFALVARIAPQNVFAFQITAALLDLLTGWLVMDMLKRLGSSPERVLIYLWNPLVVVEFAHGAHVDALMICLVAAAFWCLLRAETGCQSQGLFKVSSMLALAAGTLTKGLPILFLPLVVRRWGWKLVMLYGGIILGVCGLFAIGAGWGLNGPLDGTGLFGALRIYLDRWNFNSGIYHWLKVWLSSYQTPGAVPVDVVGPGPIRLARLITSGLMGLSVLGAGLWTWRRDRPSTGDHRSRSLALLRAAVFVVGAYLLCTYTVHPWYVLVIMPFLPFLLTDQVEGSHLGRFLWPWLYFSLAVAISYLTYINPEDLREFSIVRQVEYLPFYLLLIWAAFPIIAQRVAWMSDRRTL